MNTLFIIGNGFDLAHGLKTSYKDFIDDYLKQIFEVVGKKYRYKDDLITIKFNKTIKADYLNKELSLKATGFEKLEFVQNNLNEFQIEYHFQLLEKTIKNYQNCRWVDIEYEYYKLLTKCLGTYEEKVHQQIKELNKLFESFKNLFFNYIEKLELKKEFFETNDSMKRIFWEQTKNINNNDSICILNFNYTSLATKYFNEFEDKFKYIKYIQIHGSCADKLNNPLIFGYGDEMDKRLGDLEDINAPEAFKNIKSINYSKNKNYHTLLTFKLEIRNLAKSMDQRYNVVVLGHSCGLSDRTLLNEIFESELCSSIILYHYKKDKNNTDFEEKYSEVFRQFKSKTLLRQKVKAFDKEHFIPQWSD